MRLRPVVLDGALVDVADGAAGDLQQEVAEHETPDVRVDGGRRAARPARRGRPRGPGSSSNRSAVVSWRTRDAARRGEEAVANDQRGDAPHDQAGIGDLADVRVVDVGQHPPVSLRLDLLRLQAEEDESSASRCSAVSRDPVVADELAGHLDRQGAGWADDGEDLPGPCRRSARPELDAEQRPGARLVQVRQPRAGASSGRLSGRARPTRRSGARAGRAGGPRAATRSRTPRHRRGTGPPRTCPGRRGSAVREAPGWPRPRSRRRRIPGRARTFVISVWSKRRVAYSSPGLTSRLRAPPDSGNWTDELAASPRRGS